MTLLNVEVICNVETMLHGTEIYETPASIL